MVAILYRAYIDESGDEGFKWNPDGTGSSTWFVLAAVIVRSDVDLVVSRTINEIKQEIRVPPQKPLHWADRWKHEEKKYISQTIGRTDITISYVAINKRKLDKTETLRKPPALYFWATRLLLERVSWFVDDNNGLVDCIFENRARMSYDALTTYIRNLIDSGEHEIRPVIRNISSANKIQYKLLQMADSCASALMAAVQPDRFGNLELQYVWNLREKLYRRKGKQLGYGLKIFPNDAIEPGDTRYAWINRI